mmetsp:Transcript_2972/g.7840  ORF Transcript_2972/g.7840 Transcript_2972/m.7840 type:complete len:215 (-) Transcript_2972:2-646(-)
MWRKRSACAAAASSARTAVSRERPRRISSASTTSASCMSDLRCTRCAESVRLPQQSISPPASPACRLTRTRAPRRTARCASELASSCSPRSLSMRTRAEGIHRSINSTCTPKRSCNVRPSESASAPCLSALRCAARAADACSPRKAESELSRESTLGWRIAAHDGIEPPVRCRGGAMNGSAARRCAWGCDGAARCAGAGCRAIGSGCSPHCLSK